MCLCELWRLMEKEKGRKRRKGQRSRGKGKETDERKRKGQRIEKDKGTKNTYLGNLWERKLTNKYTTKSYKTKQNLPNTYQSGSVLGTT